MSESVEQGETSRPSRVEELDRRIAETVQGAVQRAQQEIVEHIRRTSDEMARQIEGMAPTLPDAYLGPDDLPQPVAAPAPAVGAETLLAAVQRIDSGEDQLEILQALVEEGARFADRTAFFLIREGELRGWRGAGFENGAVARLRLDAPFSGLWEQLVTGGGALLLDAGRCSELTATLDAEGGSAGALIPFMLRGRLGGAFYADRSEGAPEVANLQLLTYAASQALETLPFSPGVTPTLHPAQSAAGTGMALWSDPAGESEAVVETDSALAREPIPEDAVTEPVPTHEAEPEPTHEAELEPEPVPTLEADPVPTFEPEPIAEAQPPAEEATAPSGTDDDLWDEEPAVKSPAPPPAEPEPVAPAAAIDVASAGVELGQQTVRIDPTALQQAGQAAPVIDPVPAAEVDPPAAAEDVEPAPSEPAETAGFELEPEPESVSTQVQPPADMLPVAEEAPAPPVEAPPVEDPAPAAEAPPTEPSTQVQPPAPAASAGETSEVRPPDDLDGPGLAFAAPSGGGGTGGTGDEALHEEARRLARLLVSEIKLYNEEVIEEGRRTGNIYSRLKEDIDRSKQMYEDRIDASHLGGVDYFQQELVQRLAGGDPKLLGM